MTLRQERFEVRRPQHVEVRLPSGKLYVVAEGDEEVVVEIDGRYSGDFTVTQSGSTVQISHEARRTLGGASHDVFVKAPEGSSVDARVASADVSTRGRLADVMVATASGDLSVDEAHGSVDAKTASGRVVVDHCSGSLRARTASGRIEIHRLAGDAGVVTASGDVRITDAGGDVSTKTASGRITVDRFDGELCSIKTVSGSVRVGVPTGRTVNVDLQSLSGRIDLPSEPEAGGSGDRPMRIKAKTVSGNITIVTTAEPASEESGAA